MTSSEKPAANKRLVRLLLIALMAAVICVCAWITVPSPVPFTLQTFAVFLTALLLGGCDGTAAVFLYICIGAAGVPVFSGFQGGVGVLAGPTGGYIVGFLAIPLLYWLVSRFSRTRLAAALSLAGGLLLCYLAGTVRFLFATDGWNAENGIGNALLLCVVPFLLPDALKLALALFVGDRINRIRAKSGRT